MEPPPAARAASASMASRDVPLPAGSPTRIASIDVLRGVAVLGMLPVHIQLFALPSLARWNPMGWGDPGGSNWWIWAATQLLVDGKMISIFAMLFGAGLVMAPLAWPAHVRRTAALLVVGAAHAYLVWYGDMLVPLALCSTLAFVARGLGPRPLLALGATGLVLGFALPLALTSHALQASPAAIAEWRHQWTPRPDLIAVEIAQYRGSWLEQMAHRVPAARETHTWYFVTRLLWDMAGLMLIGMALFKTGVLSAARSVASYVALVAIGFGVGFALIGLALHRSVATAWDIVDHALVSQPLRYWGDFLVALGIVGLVMLLCRNGRAMRPLAAVGRLALTNYLLQSVICTTVFYGHGLGLFAWVDRAGLLVITAVIWGVQLAASSAWLRMCPFGPVEWALRLVIRRPRSTASRAPAAPAVTGLGPSATD